MSRLYAKRVDANLAEIVMAYRALGCRVHVTNGAWDATVQFGGITSLVEVKDGKKPPSKRKKTEAQVKLHDELMIRMVMDVGQVSDHVKSLRKTAQVLAAYMAEP